MAYPVPVRRWGAISAVLGAAALAPPPAAAGNCMLRQVAAFPITMSGMRPLMTAKINDTEVRFILDSGAFYSMLTAASAAELQLKTRPAPFGFYVTGLGGGMAQASIANVAVFTLAGVPLHNVEFLVGGSTVGSDNVGVLGQNVLHIGDVEYDLGQGMVRLIKTQDCRGSLAYWANKAGMPFSVVSIGLTTPQEPHTLATAYLNGKEIRVMFDSGAGLSMLSLKAAARAGIKLDSPGVEPAGQSYGIGKRVIASYLAPFASFKLGNEEIRNTRLRIADLELPQADMLLGPDFFLSHRIFVSNSQRKLYFSYNGGPVFNLSGTKNAGSTPAPTPAVAATPAPASTPAVAPTPTPTPAPAPASTPAAETETGAGTASTSATAAAATPNAAADGGDAADFSRRGGAASARRDFRTALADLTRACDLAPDNPGYFLQRALVQTQLKQTAAARADLDRAITLKPDFVAARVARAQSLLQNADKGGAGRDLDAANAAASPQADVRLAMAQDYLAADLPDPALAQLDLWIAAHEADARMPAALDSRCRIRAMSGGDLPRALKDCDAAMKLAAKSTPLYAGAATSRGLVRLRLGDYERSLADFDSALKIESTNAVSWYGRGIDKLRKRDISGGQSDIDRATQLWPGVAEYFRRYGIEP